MFEYLAGIHFAHYIIVLGTFVYLLNKLWDLKKELKERPIQYIDKSGVKSIREMTFLDTATNKTINYKIGNKHISIAGISWNECLGYISNIALLYQYLVDGKTDNYENNTRYLLAVDKLIGLILNLSKRFTKIDRKTQREFRKKSRENVHHIISISEDIIDFWNPVKKKIQILSKAKTLRSTLGDSFTWSSLEMDKVGKILIKPRFVKS